MDEQEATERMTITLLEKLSEPERFRVLRIKDELKKVLRRAGKLGTLAFAVLAVDIQAGRKPQLEAEHVEDKGEKMVRISLAGGGFDEMETDAMISECRSAGRPLHTLMGLKKHNAQLPDGQIRNDDPQLPSGG